MKKTPSPSSSVMTAALGLALFTLQTQATVRTWNGGGTDDFWSTAANWGGTAPATNGVDSLFFDGTTRQNTTNDFDAITVVNAGSPTRCIYFYNGGWELNGNPVTLGGAVGSVTGTNVINLDLSMTGTRTMDVGGGGELTINGVVSGTATNYGISKSGAGKLVLTATNTYGAGGTTTTTIAANTGVVKITNPHALGRGNVSITRGGTATGYLQIETQGENTITNTFNGFNSGNFGAGAVPTIENLSGTNTLTSNLRVTGTGGNGLCVYASGGLIKLNGLLDTTQNSRGLGLNGAGVGEVNGPVTDGTSTGFGIIKDGVGTWTLNGTNTYKGGTTARGGTLALGATGSISNTAFVRVYAAATFDVSAQAGGWSLQAAQALDGNGVVQGDVVAGANSILRANANAAANTVGTLTINGNLSMTGATNFFNLSSDPTGLVSPSDQIQVNGNLSVAGVNTIWLENYVNGYIPNGTYSLIKFTGSLTGDASNFTVTNFTVGARGTQGGYIVANAGSIDLVVTGTPPAVLTWTGDGVGNNWDIATSLTWLNGVVQDVFYDFDSVTFDDTATNRTVNLGVAVKPGTVVVNSTNDYAFENLGGKITGLTGLTKLGSGTLTNNVNHDYTGVTTYGGGKVSVPVIGNGAVASPLGAGGNNATRQVLSGGILEYTGPGESSDRAFTVDSNGGGISVTDPNATLVFNTTGSIVGGGNFTKSGPGRLQYIYQGQLTGTNSIIGGVLRIPTVSLFGTERTIPVFIDGGALDLNGQTMEDKPVVVKGMGDLTLGITNGAIVNLAGSQINALRFVTLTGDTAFGGTGRWDMRANPTATLSTGGNPYNLIKVGANQVSLVGVTVDPALGDIEVREGTFGYETGTTGLGNPANALTIRGNARLLTWAASTALNKPIVLDDYATLTNGSGTTTISGPVSMTGDQFWGPSIGVASGTTLNLSGVISGLGNLIKEGTGTLNLSGTNTYTGTTTVNAGKLVVSTAKASGGAITVVDDATLGVTVTGTSQLKTDTLSLGFGTAPVTIEFTDVSSTTTAPLYGTNVYGNSPLTIKVLSGSFTAGQAYPLITSDFAYYASVVLAETPPFIEGNLSVVGNTVILNVTAVSATYELWTGAQNGNWDIAGTTNWLFNGNPDSYTDGNAALFDDTASNSTVSVTTTVSPGSVYLNNNSLNYSFSGSAIAGSGSLTKQGTGSLTLSSPNSYSGGTTLGAGTLNINDDDALGTGLFTINSGTTIDATGSGPVTLTNAQTWNGNFTYTGNQAITANGTVSLSADVQITAASSTLAVGGVISDGGFGYGLSKAGAGSLALSGANTYTGGTTVNGGTVNVSGDQSAASGGWRVSSANATTVNFEAGSTVVMASNALVQVGSWPAAGTTTKILNHNGTVTNNGLLLVARTGYLNVNSNAVWVQHGDMTNSPPPSSGFSAFINVNAGGTMVYQGTNTINLSGSEGNTGQGLLNVGGTFVTSAGFEQTTATSGYGRITLRDGGVLQLSAAVPALTINGVQFALGVGGSAVGGTVDTAGFDAGISANILGTGSLTKQGAGALILEGLSTYTGDTLVNAGALVLSNSATLASSNIIIGGSATLDVSGLFSPFVLVSGQSLGNSSSTALLNGTVDATVGGLALAYASDTPALSVANGSLTLDAATLATVNNTGAALGNGSYKLISAGTGGSVVGTAPGTVTVTGNGLGTGGSASLSLTGGELFLDVTGAITVDTTPTNVTAVVVGGTNLNLSWPGSHTGWSLQAQTNNLNVGLQPGAWVTVPGSATTNAVSIPINPANPTVFFRLVYP